MRNSVKTEVTCTTQGREGKILVKFAQTIFLFDGYLYHQKSYAKLPKMEQKPDRGN